MRGGIAGGAESVRGSGREKRRLEEAGEGAEEGVEEGGKKREQVKRGDARLWLCSSR